MGFPDLPLERAEGGISNPARFAQLRQLVAGGSLTSEEHRYLKILLSKTNIDIISELPIEIVGQITDFLDLHQYVACLAVSRRWRDKFLSTPVIRAVVNRFCPSLRPVSGDTQDSPEDSLRVLHKVGRVRWACVQSSFAKPFSWEHESFFKLDPVYHGSNADTSTAYAQFGRHHDDPEPNSLAYWDALYSNGKIAWLAKRRIVVVDSLWSRTRKVFNVPTGPLVGPALQLLALGNRLIVGSMDRLLVAWDHITNNYLQKKLPGSINHAVTEGSRVAIILFSGDVFLWEFGGKLSALPTSPLRDHHGLDIGSQRSWISNLRVIFHPNSRGTLFIASAYTHYTDTKAVLKRVVYEFKGINHINTYEFEISPKSYNRKGPADVKVEIRKLLPYRRDIIGFCQHHERLDPRFMTLYETFVEFDIYDRKFTAREGEEFDYHEFGWPTMLEEADLDFLVRFYSNGFSAHSYQPEFDFKIGE